MKAQLSGVGRLSGLHRIIDLPYRPRPGDQVLVEAEDGEHEMAYVHGADLVLPPGDRTPWLVVVLGDRHPHVESYHEPARYDG